MAEFNYLEFFQEEIKNESAAIRINALTNIYLIASALGPKRTFDDLLPFLQTVLDNEHLSSDEEFLFTLAKQYAVLADYIDTAHVSVLVKPLEHLAQQEETVIRDEAVTSLCALAERQKKIVPDELVPALTRLASKQEFFTPRVSACSLCPKAYQYANEDQKKQLRTIFNQLCSDDTPMVRRAAASKMKDFVTVCSKEDLLAEMIPVYKQLAAEDTQDTIRVACVQATITIASKLNVEENRQHTVPVIKDAAEDRSWRVRLTIARLFTELCEAFRPEIANQDLITPFLKLLKDNEQEVRKEAVLVMKPSEQTKNQTLEKHVLQNILPEFPTLAQDSAQTVRAALAQVLGPVSKEMGRDVTQRQLLSIISDLMKDEFHEVRLNIVQQTGLICEVLSVDGLVHSLLHTIQSLIMDNHWRIRESVVQQVPKLAKLFGAEMFQSKLESLFLSSLRDSVHSVRLAAITNLKEVAECFGPQWTVDHLLPKIVEQYSQSAGYANRVTTLHVLPQVATVMQPDQIVDYILPVLVKATKDSVPNVRFSACKMLVQMMEAKKGLGTNPGITAAIKPTLQELEHDPDIDVQYYAQRALDHCQPA